MPEIVSRNPASRENHIAIAHSLPGRKNIPPDKVRYILVNRHSPKDPLGFEFPNRIAKHFPKNGATFSDYLRSEQDAGIHQLIEQILDSVPGGLAINVQVNRGIVDANRVHHNKAIRNILAPDTPITIKYELALIHRKIMEVIAHFVNLVPAQTPIFDLHSMEPFSTPNQPPLSHDGIADYLNAYKLRPINDQTRRFTDIIVGIEGQSPVADMRTSNIIAKEHKAAGINTAFNKPYDTGPDYPDYLMMQKHQNRVSAIDHLKTDFCGGSGEDRTFDTTHPVVMPSKVELIAEIYQEVLAQVLHATT
jgi:hypothetical protein